MKKIAVASENEKVSNHFGHCSNFNIFEVENNEIVNSEVVNNGRGEIPSLPNFLQEAGVKIVISGCMGSGARKKLTEKGIEIIVGASGDAKDVIEAYLKGELETTETECNEHQHHHGQSHDHRCGRNCGNH